MGKCNLALLLAAAALAGACSDAVPASRQPAGVDEGRPGPKDDSKADSEGDPQGEPDRDTTGESEPDRDGTLGPLIPMHKDAIHSGLIWDGEAPPKILFWMSPSEYRGTDLVDPDGGPVGTFRPEFDELVYGGFGFSGLMDESVKNRYKPDIARDNALIFDLGHPDALRNAGKFRIEELTAEDIALNEDAFSDAGHSRGLHYNLFCGGHAVLADGRWLVLGGHDKDGNAGIRKLLIFDPERETWEEMPIPPVKADYLADPTGTLFPHANPLDETNTDPPIPSDMTYQRWYPTAVTLPDGRVLILSGSDEDTSLGPERARASTVHIATPEVFDPETGEVIALENARKLLPLYPRSFVVQTGPGPDDWKVAVVGQVEEPLPSEEELLEEYDAYRYRGKTYLFDVLGALAENECHEPGERHWELVDIAEFTHEEGASAALWELDETGHPRMQKVVLFGGHDVLGDFDEVAAVESIDFADPQPAWRRQEDLIRPAARNLAVALPDGQVLVLGGRIESEEEGVIRTTLEYQLFDHRTGRLRTVAASTVPRHDHSTAHLLPDGTVIVMGGNRVDLVPENPDLAVPVAEIYRPPYLFRGSRPVIEDAPEEIEYGSRFEVQVAHDGHAVDSVVLMRVEPVTHNWSWGNRYVKLAVDRHDPTTLAVQAPALPASAPPGDYMLFVLDEHGVPSVARRVRLPLP